MAERDQWKSRVGFILAAVGCAVGLGNIWRFPYVAYKSGGGAFFIPYLTALFFVGVPLMILEHSLGRMTKGAAPTAFARIRKNWEWLGWWAVCFTMFGIILYYNVILSWCLNYFLFSFNLGWGSDTEGFFHKTFLGLSDGPFSIGSLRWPIVIGLGVIWFATWWFVYRGISKGIEIANKIMMPLLFLILVALVVWSLQLPGAGEGIKAYLTPDFSQVMKIEVWRNAFSQIFFSLSLGYGMMIAYGSYLPSRSRLTRNAIIVALTNSAVEIFAGFAVFATLGFMATQVGKPVAEVVASGPGLSFVTYPLAINQLPFGREIFGIIFFGALILAGITSSFSLLECFVSAAIDKFGWERKKLVTTLTMIGFLLGLVFATQGGLFWLDIVDNFINAFGAMAVGLLEIILIVYLFGHQKFFNFVYEESGFRVGPASRFSLCYFAPLVLIGILGLSFWENIQKPYGGYSWQAVIGIGLGWTVATMLLAYYFMKRRGNSGTNPSSVPEGLYQRPSA